MAFSEEPVGVGARFFQIAFAAEVACVPPVRRAVRHQLGVWGLESCLDIALLAAGELVANAIRHGCVGPDETITVSAWSTVDELWIGVRDPSSAQPHRRFVDEGEESGRGLELVAAVADRWGSEPASDRSGKCVWAAFRTAPKGVAE